MWIFYVDILCGYLMWIFNVNIEGDIEGGLKPVSENIFAGKGSDPIFMLLTFFLFFPTQSIYYMVQSLVMFLPKQLRFCRSSWKKPRSSLMWRI
ncbi:MULTISPECIES: hypothetical protein [unclassified Methanosarcina]|uniref:hypothetical protein n=1 Tax=unclassified Methanosarcina TaxID=2644672 RepID=UPI0012E0A6D7|nr:MULTISPECIES: hypothetical protein [unclassified Methanosarcina]